MIKGDNWVITEVRLMMHAFCTPNYLSISQVWNQSHEGNKIMIIINTWQLDGQTEGWTEMQQRSDFLDYITASCP